MERVSAALKPLGFPHKGRIRYVETEVVGHEHFDAPINGA